MIFKLTTKMYNRILFSTLIKRNFGCVSLNNFQLRNLKSPDANAYASITPYRLYSSDKKTNSDKDESQKLEATIQDAATGKISQRTRLKQAVRDYGATIIVFHVAISLASLGISYLAISNGVDAVRLLTFIGFSESVVSSKVAVGGSTFVIAYAVHKVFAPVRIAITLSVAPFIVRYLRRIKWIKPPKNKA